MRTVEQLAGKVFGHLTITKDLGRVNGSRRVEAKCVCGIIKEYRVEHIKSGGTKSCGCKRGHNGVGDLAEKSVGERFGKLVVKSVITERNKKPTAICICDCGNEKQIGLADLRSGRTNSCGCKLKQASKDRMTTHGLSGHPLYKIWKGMKRRCYNVNDDHYSDYGGRGIYVCDQWVNDGELFVEWGLLNGWRKGLDIDRENNNGIYEPINCRFVNRHIGNRNTRANVWIEYNGKKQVMMDWANELGLDYSIISYRLKAKWPIEKVLSKEKFKPHGSRK